MIISEYIEDMQHIRTWDDIKKVFGGHVQEYPGVNKDFKAGDYGRLWKIKGKNLALKITTDEDEMEVSRQLVGKKNKGFLNIYKAVELEPHKYNGKTVPRLMLKVQEFCYPIPELLELTHSSTVMHLMETVMNNFEDIFKEGVFDSAEDLQEFYSKLAAADYYNLQRLSQSVSMQKTFTPILIKFIDLLKRVSTDIDVDFEESLDIHGDNIMQTKEGVWKLVDF